LWEAAWIARRGGFLPFLGMCFTGEYPFCNRHPLVPVMVSPWAAQSLRAVLPMRAAKVLISAGGLLAVFLLSWRIAFAPAALCLIALLALSRNWFAKAPVVCAEPLVYALFFSAWVLIAGAVRPRGRWLLAGAATGVTYLAKGTGIFLLLSLPLAAVLHLATRSRVASDRRAAAKATGLFLAGFLVCAGPLLWRNAVRFGNPFYNSNTELMWADDWSARLMTEEQRAQTPLTFWSYLRSHSVGDVIRRLGFGLRKQVPRLLGSLAADSSFGGVIRFATLGLSCGIVLAGLAAVGRSLRSWCGAYTAVLVGVSVLAFVWYSPITFASRFAATLGPILGLAAFCPSLSLLRRAAGRLRRWHGPGSILIAVSASVLLWSRVNVGELLRRRGEVPTAPEYRFLLDWSRREVEQGGAACVQTPYLGRRFPFHWLLAEKARIYNLPPLKTLDEMNAYAASVGARFLIVEKESRREWAALFRGFIEEDAAGNLVLKAAPPGWRAREQDPYPPVDFVILERSGG